MLGKLQIIMHTAFVANCSKLSTRLQPVAHYEAVLMGRPNASHTMRHNRNHKNESEH